MTARELQELRRRLEAALDETERRIVARDRDDPPTITRRQQLAAERSSRDSRVAGRGGDAHR